MKTRERMCWITALALLLGVAALVASWPWRAGADVLTEEDEKGDQAGDVLKKVRVLAFDLPSDPPAASSGRVVLVRLDRKDQMIVKPGQIFEPEVGLAFTVDKINKDGSVYVSGSGISMGWVKVATKAEREAWTKKLREGGFDS